MGSQLSNCQSCSQSLSGKLKSTTISWSIYFNTTPLTLVSWSISIDLTNHQPHILLNHSRSWFEWQIAKSNETKGDSSFNNLVTNDQHIEAWKRYGYFVANIFKCIFLVGNVHIMTEISMKLVPEDPIDNKLALVYMIAWCRIGHKQLSEQSVKGLWPSKPSGVTDLGQHWIS